MNSIIIGLMNRFKVFRFILFVSLLVTVFSCEKEKKINMKNNIKLGFEKAGVIDEDDTEGLDAYLLLALTQDKEEINVKLRIKGDEQKLLRLESEDLTILKSQKKINFKIFSNNKSLLTESKTFVVEVLSCSDKGMDLSQARANLTVNPVKAINLSDAQKQLIAGYNSKYGIDLNRLIGRLNFRTVVKYTNEEDRAKFNDGKEERIIEGTTLVTLSEQATKDKIVLKMPVNPLGMRNFLYDILYDVTWGDKEYFPQTPNGEALMKVFNFDKLNEKFVVVLDNINFLPPSAGQKSGEVEFLSKRNDRYDAPQLTIPFDYSFSLWDRMKAVLDAGGKVKIKENTSEEEEINVEEIVTQGGSMNPEVFFVTSGYKKDEYDKPENFFKTNAEYDFTTGKVKFSICFNFDGSVGYQCCGYIHLHIIYDML